MMSDDGETYMNDFSKFNKIRKEIDRETDCVSNVREVAGESGFRCLHILWLYPDVMNIHGGRGDIMGLLHISTVLGIPVEIRRWDRLKQTIDWNWPHLVYMSAGELKCAPNVIAALKKQEEGLKDFVERGGTFVANGSSGAVLADSLELYDGKKIKGLGLLHMEWKERNSVWGDDIWVEVADTSKSADESNVIDLIGNQIQVADVTLCEGQEALGSLVYGRGNNGAEVGSEGARSGNVIYTGVLGPLISKNPLFAEMLLKQASQMAEIEIKNSVRKDKFEMEFKSAEYIKAFMKNKM